MFHLLSTVIQSFLFLHKHITLTFYLPFPFLVHPLYAFNSHWTLPNFSFLCLSLSFPYTLPIHTYFLSQYFFPLANLSPCPPPTTFPHVSVNVSETRISNYILLIFCSVKNHLFTVLKSAITFFRLIFLLSSLNDDTNRPTHLSKLNSMS